MYTERSLRWDEELLDSSMSDSERKEPVRCKVRADLVGWGLEKDIVRLRELTDEEPFIGWRTRADMWE